MYCDPFFSVNIDSLNEYAGPLKALFTEYATALTKCAPEEFDALYEQYSQQYLDAGFQEIIDERLQAYKDGNSTKLPDVPAGRAEFTPYDPQEVVPRLYTIGE